MEGKSLPADTRRPREAAEVSANPRENPTRPWVGIGVLAFRGEDVLLIRRGRPPRRVYINVLVKATTREGLTRMKATESLPSQGEVIDMLVAQALAQKPKRGE